MIFWMATSCAWVSSRSGTSAAPSRVSKPACCASSWGARGRAMPCLVRKSGSSGGSSSRNFCRSTFSSSSPACSFSAAIWSAVSTQPTSTKPRCGTIRGSASSTTGSPVSSFMTMPAGGSFSAAAASSIAFLMASMAAFCCLMSVTFFPQPRAQATRRTTVSWPRALPFRNSSRSAVRRQGPVGGATSSAGSAMPPFTASSMSCTTSTTSKP
mmetsp:Transcript_7649/g.22582  ORF Transcript_7649/g.22582 Transcript_7649/m.22582 type:complete len:212 (+) Transcript_7649:120-755(+)